MIEAWIDESESDQRLDPHTYVLAAAVGFTADAAGQREVMRGLRLPGQRKLHWRDESAARRWRIITVIAALELEHVVVVRDGRAGERPERRRRRCLAQLLPALEALDVTRATVESRGPTDDRRDMEMLQNLRRQHLIGSRLRLHHEPGASQPMLWIPDAVCGAVTRGRRGDGQYLTTLTGSVEVITIDATT